MRDIIGEKPGNGRRRATMEKTLILNQPVDICVGHRKPFESPQVGEQHEQIWCLEKELTSVLQKCSLQNIRKRKASKRPDKELLQDCRDEMNEELILNQ